PRRRCRWSIGRGRRFSSCPRRTFSSCPRRTGRSRRSALGEDDPLSFEERGVERPLAHCRKVEVVAAAFALFSEPHVGDASSTGLLGGVADAGPAPRTMLAAATTSVHTSRGATYSQVPEVHPCGLSSGSVLWRQRMD